MLSSPRYGLPPPPVPRIQAPTASASISSSASSLMGPDIMAVSSAKGEGLPGCTKRRSAGANYATCHLSDDYRGVLSRRPCGCAGNRTMLPTRRVWRDTFAPAARGVAAIRKQQCGDCCGVGAGAGTEDGFSLASEATGVTGLAERYAAALFDLADERRNLDEVAS